MLQLYITNQHHSENSFSFTEKRHAEHNVNGKNILHKDK